MSEIGLFTEVCIGKYTDIMRRPIRGIDVVVGVGGKGPPVFVVKSVVDLACSGTNINIYLRTYIKHDVDLVYFSLAFLTCNISFILFCWGLTLLFKCETFLRYTN